MNEFLKELFTLRTVYIDKGRGRWAVRKRLHPLLRGILTLIIICVCGVAYLKSDGIHSDEAVAKNSDIPEIKEVKTVKLIEPVPMKINLPPISVKTQEPEKVLAQVQKIDEIDKKNNERKTLTIPAKKKTEIILPSDKIIQPKKNDKFADKYRLVVNKSAHKLSLLKGNVLIKEYGIATGQNTGDKQRVGDHRTPTGEFKIVSIENASGWSHDFRDGKGKIAGAYGPWFLRLDAKGWRGIGIHGTHDPNSIGTNATEGCIRLNNADIAELKENYAYRNMPVEIRED